MTALGTALGTASSAAAALVMACSGSEFETGEPAPGASAAGNAMASAGGDPAAGGASSSGGTTARAPDCPSSVPTAGAQCQEAGAQCSYGSSVQPSCRQRFQCSGGRWVVLSPGECTRDSTCPGAVPEVGADCVSRLQICSYDSEAIFCGCPACESFCASERWICSEQPGGSCPDLLPNEGTLCDDSGRECDYGSCPLGDAMRVSCNGSRWTWVGDPCG